MVNNFKYEDTQRVFERIKVELVSILSEKIGMLVKTPMKDGVLLDDTVSNITVIYETNIPDIKNGGLVVANNVITINHSQDPEYVLLAKSLRNIENNSDFKRWLF